MYSKKELDKIRALIIEEIKECYFQLGITETELSFYQNQIREEGKKYGLSETNIALEDLRKAIKARNLKIKKEIEELNSLYSKLKEGGEHYRT